MDNQEVERRSNRQILKGSAVAYLSLAVNIISGIVYTPWMIRQIGQSNYGLYTLAVSLISILMMDFGIGSALARFAAKYRAQEGLSRFTGLAYKLYFAIDLLALCISVIIFCFLDTIYANLTAEEMATFRIVYVMVVGYNLIAFPCLTLDGLLTACEEFVALRTGDLLTRIITIIFVVAALYMGGGLFSLVAANIVSGTITILYKWWIVHHRLHLKVIWRGWDTKLLREVFTFSAWSTVGSVAYTLNTNLMPSIVAAMAGALQTAIYGAAVTLNGYAFSISHAISGLFLPKVSRIYYNENTDQRAKENVTSLGIRVGRIQMYIAAILLIGFWCIGEEFFVIWMGADYRPAYLCASILMAGELAIFPFMIFHTAMTVQGYMKPLAFNTVFAAVLALGSGVVATKYFGEAGAAAAACMGNLVKCIILICQIRHYLGIDIRYFLGKIYNMVPIYGVLLLVCYWASHLYIAQGWLVLGIKAVLIAAAFAVVTVRFVLEPEEKTWMAGLLGKALRR